MAMTGEPICTRCGRMMVNGMDHLNCQRESEPVWAVNGLCLSKPLTIAEPLGGYCRDCKWWGEAIDDIGTVLENQGCCELAGASDGQPVHNTLAWALDMERYAAELRTKPDFGCVQFEAKE